MSKKDTDNIEFSSEDEAYNAHFDVSVSRPNNYNPNITGVSGWLGFLVFSMMILNPVFGFLKTYGDISTTEEINSALLTNDIWQSLKLSNWIIFALQASIIFTGGWRLNNIHEPSSVKFAIGSLWVGGPLLSFISLIVAGAIVNINLMGRPEVVGSILSSLIAATIWSLYLIKSSRVWNTYHSKAAVNYNFNSRQKSQASFVNKIRLGSKFRRQFVFFSFAWMLLLIAFALLEIEFLFEMGDGESLLLWMFVPPLFVGALLFAYRRFVDSKPD